MATATAPARAGGRFPPGRVVSPTPGQAPGKAGPATASPPPAGSQGAVPRKGGRTQQGARQQPRTGGRSQQGTQSGATVPPVPQRPGQAPPGPSAAPPAARPGLAARAGADSSGAVLVIFAYPLFFNLLRGGPAQMWGWVKAKFINQPYAPGTGSGSAAAPPAQPGLVQQGGFVGLAVPGQPAPAPVLSPTGRYPL